MMDAVVTLIPDVTCAVRTGGWGDGGAGSRVLAPHEALRFKHLEIVPDGEIQ